MKQHIKLGLVTMLAAMGMVLLAGSLDLKASSIDKDEDLPFQLREELESVLRSKASKLYGARNEEGLRYQRATYSKKLKKIDQGTYQVTFIRDTAGPERMQTERFLLTLRRDGSGEWIVAEEAVQDSYHNLVRPVPGDEEYLQFNSFRFDREGLEVTASRGNVIVDYLLGEPSCMVLTGSNLRYKYEPPSDLGHCQAQIYAYIQKERASDFVFEPDRVFIDCDSVSCHELLDSCFTKLQPVEFDSLGREARKAAEAIANEQNKEREERPFSGFELPADSERRQYSLAITKDDRHHLLGLTYDNDSAWEVQFWAKGYGTLFGYPSEESRRDGIVPYDIEARDDDDAKLYELRALSGEVEIGLEHPELLKADLTFTIRAKRDLREIPFCLNNVRGVSGEHLTGKMAGITIDVLQTADGKDLTWVRRGSSGGLVILPEEVPCGSEIVLRMAFQTKDSVIKLTPSYSYMDRSGWLPFVRFTDKIEDFALTVQVPARFKVLGIGTKAEEHRDHGVATTRWVAHSPVTFPTIIFGDYIEDSPKTKATKLDGTEIPVTIHVDRDGMTDWQIRQKQLRPLAEQAVNALNLYREIYGVDYPYGKLDLVNDPLGFLYGQSPASIVYLGSGAFRGEGVLALASTDASYLTKASRSLVAHEVAHQWWGSLIGNSNMRNYWFIESLAEYSAALFLEAVNSDGGSHPEKGWNAYLDHVAGWRKNLLDTDLMCSVQDATALWSGDGSASYQAAIYSQGPYCFHILRMTFGSEKLFQFLNNLAQEFAGKEIVTSDIQRIAEQSFGGNMDWFFDQWIRGIGIPEYSFNFDFRQTEDGNYLIQGDVKQRVVAGTRKREMEGVYYRGIVSITVLGRDDKEYSARILVEGADTFFAFKVPVEPVEISLNRDGEILAHDVLENRSW